MSIEIRTQAMRDLIDRLSRKAVDPNSDVLRESTLRDQIKAMQRAGKLCWLMDMISDQINLAGEIEDALEQSDLLDADGDHRDAGRGGRRDESCRERCDCKRDRELHF